MDLTTGCRRRRGGSMRAVQGRRVIQRAISMRWHGTANSSSETHPVGEKQPNGFGLYDMHGNMREWCHASYAGVPTDGSAWLSGGKQKYRALRGGSWDDYAHNLRSAIRNLVRAGQAQQQYRVSCGGGCAYSLWLEASAEMPLRVSSESPERAPAMQATASENQRGSGSPVDRRSSGCPNCSPQYGRRRA